MSKRRAVRLVRLSGEPPITLDIDVARAAGSKVWDLYYIVEDDIPWIQCLDASGREIRRYNASACSAIEWVTPQ